jgi:hypothetical protein
LDYINRVIDLWFPELIGVLESPSSQNFNLSSFGLNQNNNLQAGSGNLKSNLEANLGNLAAENGIECGSSAGNSNFGGQ